MSRGDATPYECAVEIRDALTGLREDLEDESSQLLSKMDLICTCLRELGTMQHNLFIRLVEKTRENEAVPLVVHIAVEGRSGNLEAMRGFASLADAEAYMMKWTAKGHHIVVFRNVPVSTKEIY